MDQRATRTIHMPDQLKLERCRRDPEQGPAILFFSGGTALREMSRKLIEYTHNSLHVITPFDSGGSSAVLRRAFSMPAVGDIRNRLMALADQSVFGNNGVYALFTHRLSKNSTREELLVELRRMESGEHFLMHHIPGVMNEVIREYLTIFLEAMPDDFDLRGASIGNLVLTAGYLNSGGHLIPVIETFSELAQVLGLVQAVVDADLHLAVRLENGDVIVGQHLITGKEAPPLTSNIDNIWLTESLESSTPVNMVIDSTTASRIVRADLICYPPGSFFSSVAANLLPMSVGWAVAQNQNTKVFVPSTGVDPEARGMSVADQVDFLIELMHRGGAPEGLKLVDCVLVDLENGEYPGGLDAERLHELDVDVVDARLVTPASAPDLDSKLLSRILVSMA